MWLPVQAMNDNSPMLARLSAFVVWALVAGAIVFWGLRLFVSPTPAPGNAVAVVESVGGGGDLSRLFGAEAVAAAAAPPPESTRFKLLGVLSERGAGGATGPGVALVSIDGKPPRPYRAGARVEDQLTLQSVSARSASFGPAQGEAAFTLEVPRMPEPATGTLNPVDPSQLQVSRPQPPVAPQPVQQAPVVPQQAPPPNANQPDGQPSGPMGAPPPGNETPFRHRGGPGGPGGANQR